ncbi:hypothetical protein JB92DRAFT_758907 [Gautieria morchelliformis]|nr:hypothetical protein JB92DRAFT_758907 [Gautieria morchelliformis]
MPPYGSAPQASPYNTQRYYDQTRGPVNNDFDPEPDNRRWAPAGYMKGEQVEVRIRGNIWIVGLLVSSLHLISSYLGKGYDVEYKDQRGQAYRDQFREEDVRPYPR